MELFGGRRKQNPLSRYHYEGQESDYVALKDRDDLEGVSSIRMTYAPFS